MYDQVSSGLNEMRRSEKEDELRGFTRDQAQEGGRTRNACQDF